MSSDYIERLKMISAIGVYCDLVDAGKREFAEREWLSHIPDWQVRAAFADFAPRCPDRITIPDTYRNPSALHIDPPSPTPRCRLRTPEDWGDADHRAARWLLSGGSPLVLGECACRWCPRARRKTVSE